MPSPPSLRVHSLPDRPDHPLYAERLAYIEEAPTRRERSIRKRAFVEEDFWAYEKWVMSFGKYKVADSAHKRHGLLWIDDPVVFDRCRALQESSEAGEDDVFWNWPRFEFKTELVTKGLSLWELWPDLLLTFGLLTHKVDQAGEQIFRGIQEELERNEELRRLYPHALRADVKEYPLWTKTALTIIRPLGPREPTFSIHGLDHLPTSAHYRRLIRDDCVVSKTVVNERAIDQAEARIQESTALGQDDTITRDVGTIWAADDPNMRNVKKGVYSRRDHRRGLEHKKKGVVWTASSSVDDPDWRPVLRSREFLKKWRKKLGAYSFSCQIQGEPVAKSEQVFEVSWLREYDRLPEDPKLRGLRYIVIDSAGTEGSETSDFWIWAVVELRGDGNIYHLDLWRERATLIDVHHLTFALVRLWEPDGVFIEETGNQGYFSAIKQEMNQRAFHFRLRKIRSGHWQFRRKKVDRILLLQPSYERGEHWYPHAGFRHGSGPLYIDQLRRAVQDPTLEDEALRTRVADKRDTLVQFREDEYTKWTPVPGSVLHDDGLDTKAWLVQDETRHLFRFPEKPSGTPDYSQHGHPVGAGVLPAAQRYGGGVSGWSW